MMLTAPITINPESKSLFWDPDPGPSLPGLNARLTSDATWLAAQKPRTSSRGHPERPSALYIQCGGWLVPIGADDHH